jgi:hypothetical protein
LDIDVDLSLKHSCYCYNLAVGLPLAALSFLRALALAAWSIMNFIMAFAQSSDALHKERHHQKTRVDVVTNIPIAIVW